MRKFFMIALITIGVYAQDIGIKPSDFVFSTDGFKKHNNEPVEFYEATKNSMLYARVGATTAAYCAVVIGDTESPELGNCREDFFQIELRKMKKAEKMTSSDFESTTYFNSQYISKYSPQQLFTVKEITKIYEKYIKLNKSKKVSPKMISAVIQIGKDSETRLFEERECMYEMASKNNNFSTSNDNIFKLSSSCTRN